MRNDVNGIVAEIISLDERIAQLKAQRDSLQAEAQSLIQPDIDSQLSEKDYGCGTVNIDTGEYLVKVVISKKVSYSQEQLAEIAERIRASGEDVSEYVKIKYDVSEAKFKNWPQVLQNEFVAARTVEQSTPKITFQKKD